MDITNIARIGIHRAHRDHWRVTMLSQDQCRDFERDGYVVLENLIDTASVLDPLIEEYEELLDGLRKGWVADGRLDPAAPASSFQDLIKSAYHAGLDYFQPMDISLPPGDITPNLPFHAGPAVFRMMTDGSLLDSVESLIGPEITSNPIQHVRIKPPAKILDSSENRAHITATGWHQDRAVTLEEADTTRMVTCWLAVTDATVENGCLRVIPGSHRGQMMPHCPNPQLAIPDDFIDHDSGLPLPVKAGGAILFHPLTVHGSLPNTTSEVRWSFDLRYNVTGDPTGRPMFPDFVARSRNAPETEMDDAKEWRRMWERARHNLSYSQPVQIHRWSADALPCA
jgi:phytanoyl-CoA hydroxylase